MRKVLPYTNLQLKDMPGEKWKPLPGLEDYYEVSNLGRVKRIERWVERKATKSDMLLKERILGLTKDRSVNPYTRKISYRLAASLCVNWKKYQVTVARMVYYLFVRKFDLEDPTLVIMAKDGENLNAQHTNLKLVKKGMVQELVYRNQKKRRPFKKVSQYDEQGRLIKTYPSLLAAEKELGLNRNTISLAANGALRYCFGYVWKFGERKKIPPVGHLDLVNKRITQYTLRGKFVKEYPSVKQAGIQTGFDENGIRSCAKGRRGDYKGYKWEFTDNLPWKR